MKRTVWSAHNVCRGLKALAAAVLLLSLAQQTGATPPYAVVCYASTSNEASPTNLNDGSGPGINWSTDVPWGDITVVADAFLLPNSNDTFSNGGAKGNTLISAAHANGVRCIVALSAGAFSTLCLPGNTAPFATAVTNMLSQDGYDGVEVDWEQTGVATQANATDMMEAMYTAIKAMPNCAVDGKPHTLSFTTNPAYSQIYDMTTLGSYTDWCFFMGYDWYDTPATYANGPLNGVNPSIAGTIDGMTNGSQWSYPVSKMIVGCPFYTNDYNAGTFYDTLSIIHLGTAGAYNTSYAEQAYTAPDGNTVYVDTAQSFCDKTNWALSSGCKGIGMWDMGQALPYTDSAVTAIWNTIGGQASCLNLGPTSTPTKTPTPVVASSWRVVAGGPAHTDCNSNVWAADENYVGGTAATSTDTITGALPCSTDQALYQDQRYGPSFSYVFNVPAGSYQVTLKFAETYWTAAGDREFNVAINGTTELTNFDIFATAGGENIAVDKVYNNIAPSTGGAITITFGPASVDNAMVSSIQIIPQPATATPTPTFSKTVTSTYTLTASATPTLTDSMTPTASLTATPTASPTSSATETATKTSSNTPTSTYTSSYTPTGIDTSTPVNTPSSTPTRTSTSSATASFTATLSSTPTNTPVGTLTPVNTPTGTATSSPTNTGTSTPTASFTASFTPTLTRTSTNTLTLTATPTNSATNTPAVPTATKTYSFTPSATVTNSFTATGTATPSSSNTGTASPTATYSFTFTKTATATATWTNTNTPVFTDTPVPFTSTPTAVSICSGVAAWNGNFVYYAIGVKVTYDGELYQCIQAHTSESTWEPNIVPALWKALGPCGEATPVPVLAVAQPVVYPNPATSGMASIQLPLIDPVNVKVQVFTVAMRQVQNTTVPQVFGNTLTVQLVDKGGVSLANGLYYFIIQAGGQKWTTKVLILR